ncbi:MAG: hypothetical protein GY906_34860, partial [bacterium]|nr:hypothetical protein [bacterium]
MKSRAVVSIVSCLTLCAAAAVAQTMEVRSYDLQHADMPEVVDLVQDLLSDEGSVTVRPRSSQLHVQDRSEFISVVDQFIKDIDQPPEPFRLIVELVEASMDPLMGETEYEPIHGVKRMFRYDHYRLVGAAAVEGKLGEDYLVSLGNDFQVQFGTSQVVIPGGFFHHR